MVRNPVACHQCPGTVGDDMKVAGFFFQFIQQCVMQSPGNIPDADIVIQLDIASQADVSQIKPLFRQFQVQSLIGCCLRYRPAVNQKYPLHAIPPLMTPLYRNFPQRKSPAHVNQLL